MARERQRGRRVPRGRRRAHHGRRRAQHPARRGRPRAPPPPRRRRDGIEFINDEVVGWARDQRRGHGAMGDAQVAGAEHATEARAVGGRRTRGRVRVRVLHVRQG